MIIYKTTNLINDKFYVGKDLKNNPNYLGSGVILKRAIKKYGKENFKKEILEYCNTRDELNEREKYWINKMNSIIPHGYNISIGGDGGDNLTNNPNILAIKEKMKNSAKNKIITAETRLKYSIRSTGENNNMYGKHHTKLAKQKISNAHTGRIFPDSRNEKIRQSKLGTKLSEETKEKLRNIVHTIEWTEKIQKSRSNYAISIETKNKISKTLLGSKQSQETCSKKSESHKNLIWINNMNKEKQIKLNEFANYTDLGWVKGRIKHLRN